MTTIILDEFRRKEKTAEIFLNIKKTYEKTNKKKIFQQLENLGIPR